MPFRRSAILVVCLAGLSPPASAQMAAPAAGAAPGSGMAGRGMATPGTAPDRTAVSSQTRMDRDADAARKAFDQRMTRRDATVRRSLKGICTGC